MSERALPWLVVVAAAVGMVAPSAGRSVADEHGIDVVLALLVLASGLSLGPRVLRAARSAAGRITAAAVAGLVVLPVLAWAAGHLAPAGPLRDGVVALGVAPTEVAAVAITTMAGGSASITAGILVLSAIATVLAAGPILAGLTSAAGGAPAGSVLVTLLVVVGIPLLVGLVVRRSRAGVRLEPFARPVSVAAVVVLVWLVASQIEVGPALASTVLAAAVFAAGSLLLGAALALGAPPPAAHAVRLSIAMRDFAVAAGTATAAFGPRAAAPAGVYGALVLLLGAVYARAARRGRRRPLPRRRCRAARRA